MTQFPFQNAPAPNQPRAGMAPAMSPAILFFVIYAFIIPMLMELITADISNTGAFHGRTDPILWLVIWIVIAYSGAKLAWLSTSRYTPIFRLPFWIFIYVWVGLIPYFQIQSNYLPWYIRLPDSDYIYGYSIVIIGLVGYELGLLLGRNRDPIPTNPLPPTNLDISTTRTVIFTIAAAAITLYTAFFIVGINSIISSRNELKDSLNISQGAGLYLISTTLLRIPALVASMILMLAMFTTSGARRYLYSVLFVITLPVLMISSFPTSTSRTWLGTAVLGFMAILYLRLRKRSFHTEAFLIIAAVILIFPLGSLVRNANSVVSYENVITTIGASYGTGDFDTMQMISATLHHADATGIVWGRQLLGPAAFWMPRSWWPNKPIGSGAVVAQGMGFNFTNVSCPLWGEMYLNFGIPGVFFAFIGYGMLSHWFEKKYNAPDSSPFIYTLICFLSFFQFIILRGDLMVVTTLLSPFVVVLFVFAFGFGRTPLARQPRHPSLKPPGPVLAAPPR